MLELLDVTENRYSGIPTIRKAFQEANLPAPIFNVYHGEFTVTFKNNIYKSETTNINKEIVEFCKIPRTRAELIEFTGFSRQYTMSAIIQPLIDEGKLKLTIPNKPKSSKQQYVKA